MRLLLVAIITVMPYFAKADAFSFYCDIGVASNDPSGTEEPLSIRVISNKGEEASGTLPPQEIPVYKGFKVISVVNLASQKIFVARKGSLLNLKMINASNGTLTYGKELLVNRDGNNEIGFSPVDGVKAFFSCVVN